MTDPRLTYQEDFKRMIEDAIIRVRERTFSKTILTAISALVITAVVGFWSLNGQLAAMAESIRRIDLGMVSFDKRLTYVERRTSLPDWPYGRRTE